MAMDEDVETLERIIGHDGSEIIHPELKSPGNRKGFHWQEIIDAALVLNYAVVPIEARPIQTATGTDSHEVKFGDFETPEERLLAYLDNTKGVLTGIAPSGYWHAVAWDGEQVYDPQGRVYSLSDIKIGIQIYWLFIPIKSISNSINK
jgi:hypothetical protein